METDRHFQDLSPVCIPSIIERDPIEDSQARLSPDIVRISHRHSSTPLQRNQIHRAVSRSHHGSKAKTFYAPVKASSAQIHRKDQTHRKSPKESGLAAISDGFVGLEIRLPVTRPQKRTTKTNSNIRKTKKATVTNVGLPLAQGFLPPPCFPAATLEVSPNSTNAQKLTFTRGSGRAEGVCSAGVDRNTHEPVPYQRATAGMTSHAEHTIRDQLATVIAPTRQESDTETSDSEAEDVDDNSSGFELHADSGGYDAVMSESSQEQYYPGYFGEANYFLSMQDETDFQQHYGGTD